MKSAILNNGKVEIIEVKKPSLTDFKDKGAIIKVMACGLCGSDIVKIKHAAQNPDKKVVLGHEVVGEIVEINTNVVGNSYFHDNTLPFKAGDIVCLGHHYPCMECDFCKNGNHSMCRLFKSVNIRPAGFSEYIFVSEGHLKNTVFKLKNGMNIENATFMEPLSCCIRAIRRSGYNFDPGILGVKSSDMHESLLNCGSDTDTTSETLTTGLKGNIDTSKTLAGREQNAVTAPEGKALVIGLGSIGLLMSLGLKAFGVEAFGFDINPERQDFASKFGVGFDQNLRYDSVFMTSGSYKAIDTAFKYVKDGGKILVFSSVEGDFGYKNNEIYYRELTVLGSYSPAPVDLALSFELLSRGIIDLQGISTFYTLDNLPSAVNDTMLNKIFKACVKL